MCEKLNNPAAIKLNRKAILFCLPATFLAAIPALAAHKLLPFSAACLSIALQLCCCITALYLMKKARRIEKAAA